MKFRRLVRALGVLALAALAASGSPGTSAAPPRPRAFLLSFDGCGGQMLEALLEDPARLSAGGFRAMRDRGLWAKRSVPPSPSLTAVSHVTLATGALPRATGIVSNWMLDPSRPFGSAISGFDAPIRAETLWEAARRQGRRTAVVLFPGADGRSLARSADYALTWPADAGLSRPIRKVLTVSDWAAAPPAPEGAPRGDSPEKVARIPFGEGHMLQLTAVDSADDGKTAYDLLRAAGPKGPPARVQPGEWFPIEVESREGRTGAWCKLLALPADLAKVEVYIGRLARNQGYPAAFVSEIDGRVGFWPGVPDGTSFGADSDRPDVFLEQAERIADFITRAQREVLARNDWDLLLGYQPQLDETGHEFLLEDPAQPGYTAEKAKALQELYARSYEIADRAVASIVAALRPGDSLFLTSDHGMRPIWNEIFPNVVLREAGLLTPSADGRGIDPSSAAAAVCSGAIAHVSIRPDAPEGTLARAEKALRELRVRGESPWDVLLRREEAGPLGLDARESGDLIAIAKPGFVVGRSAERRGPVGPPNHLGAHGYRNAESRVHSFLLAAGPEIRHGTLDSIGSWTIAARVARAIGIDPPKDAAREP